MITNKTLSTIERAKTLLQSASSFDDILAVANLAARARDLAKAAGAGKDVVNAATKVMLDARRRAGLEIKGMKERGELADKGRREESQMSQPATFTLDDIGITRSQSSRYQQEASVPGDAYNAWVASVNSDDRHERFLSAAGLRKLAVQQPTAKDSTVKTKTLEGCETVTSFGDLSDRMFSCVYADPPWQYSNQQTRAATDNHYQTMTVDQLCKMPVCDIVAKDAHLHLWTTSGFLFDAKRVMEAWGFMYKSSFVWVKPQMGIGNYWRLSHEFLLLGVRGNATRFNDHSLRSWAEIKRGKHSAKPEEIRHMIERASNPPYLELFGRKPVTGWTVFGNQVVA